MDPGALDGMLIAYRTALIQAGQQWLSAGQVVFAILAALQITKVGFDIAVARSTGDGAGVGELYDRLLVVSIAFGLLQMLMSGVGYWLGSIVVALANLGRMAGVFAAPPGPSETLDVGIQIAFNTLDFSDVPVTLGSIGPLLLALAAQVAALGAFTAVAALLVYAWVRAFAALFSAPLILALGASQWTARFAENHLTTILEAGLRLFYTYAMYAIGMNVMLDLASDIRAAPGTARTQQVVVVAAVVWVFAYITATLPRDLAGRITASSSWGLAESLRGRD